MFGGRKTHRKTRRGVKTHHRSRKGGQNCYMTATTGEWKCQSGGRKTRRGGRVGRG